LGRNNDETKSGPFSVLPAAFKKRIEHEIKTQTLFAFSLAFLCKNYVYLLNQTFLISIIQIKYTKYCKFSLKTKKCRGTAIHSSMGHYWRV